MSFSAGVVANVFLVRWSGPPQLPDARHLVDLVAKARAKLGSPLVFCSILAEKVGPPAADLRSNLGEVVRGIRPHTSSMNIVLMGDGVGRLLLRTVMRGALVAAGQAGTVFIHDGLEEVLERHKGQLTMDPVTLLQEARRQQLAP